DAQGDGLASLAFATADLDRAHRRLARLGLEPEPLADGESSDATNRRRAAPPGASLEEGGIRTPDPERATALYGARLGLDMRLDRANPAWGARLLFFRCGDLIVEGAHDLAAGAGLGAARPWGLSWRVPDAEAARARLRSAGLDVSEVRPGRKPGTHALTLRGGTCGAPTRLLQP